MKLARSRKIIQKSGSGRFSEFFLHASDSEKKEILRKAAHKANLEQRAVFKRAQLKIKVS